MNVKCFVRALLVVMPVWAGTVLPDILSAQSPDRPNILWVVNEDNSAWIGAYGDDFATTPSIDRLICLTM